MNGLVWTVLILAAMIGALLFVTIGVVVFALLLANVSGRLARNDEIHRDP
ncbi:hypothetical protein [Paraburkholderia sp. ZP32-5]|nr:hypothetical protein [Paraburkholderia sp. ZP32-5]